MDETPQTPAITQRGLEVLQALWDFTRKRGYPPTIRELAAALGIASSQGVYDHIRRLQGRGLVTRPPRGQARGLQLTPAGWAALGAAPPGDALRSVLEVAEALVLEARQHHRGRDSELVGTSQGDLRYLPRLLPLLRSLEVATALASAELDGRKGDGAFTSCTASTAQTPPWRRRSRRRCGVV